MAKVVIRDVSGLNGEYDLDLTRFTNDELRLIKRESGVRAGEIEDAMRAFDNDLLVCFAQIAVKRSGRPASSAAFWEADVGAIELDLSDEDEGDDAAVPPASESASPASESASGESSSASGESASEASPET